MQASGQDQLRGFAPQVSFPFGMITQLEQVSPEALLPGAATIPPNTALTLQGNTAQIAAYMVGLNTEISRLLLWRGVPADPRATPFTYFWDQRGQAGGGPDISPIAGWAHTATLSAQVAANSGGVFLAVRADLLIRYPTTAVYAAPPGTTSPIDLSKIVQPAFTASLPPDLHLYAFPGIAPATAVGPPGCFFVFQQQASETRFGTDPLTQAKLTAPPGSYWTVASLVAAGAPVPARADVVANTVLMLPGLVAIHASVLLPPGG